MWLLVALMFSILYGVVTAVGSWMGAGNALFYLILAFLFIGFQYLIGPSLVGLMMRVRWVSEEEEPELHRMVGQLAERAGIPKPRVGISHLAIPNAFAFGRTLRDGRVCITQGIQRLLNKDELKAVLGHELSHLRNRDMMIITLLSVIPLMLYWLAWSMLWGGMFGRRREAGGYAALIGLGAMLLYFITNLLVLYGSRIREYYADRGSVRLGNAPQHLATALYRLVYGSAQLRRDPRIRGEFQRVEGVKAFFLNDVSRAHHEISELREIDRDLSGTIDPDELRELRQKRVKLRGGERIMELFTTHPNMLKRIKHLAHFT
jgi:heat shock protein HtpX